MVASGHDIIRGIFVAFLFDEENKILFFAEITVILFDIEIFIVVIALNTEIIVFRGRF